MGLTLSYDFFNEEKDKYIPLEPLNEKSKYVWICDYKNKEIEDMRIFDKLYGKIEYKGNAEIMAGGSTKTFTFIPMNKNGEVLDSAEFSWNIEFNPDYEKSISYTIDEYTLKLKVQYDNLIIGETINITINDKNNDVVTNLDVVVEGGI